MKPTKIKYYCRYCGCEYLQPIEEYGKAILAVYCPICLTEKKRRKMIQVKNG